LAKTVNKLDFVITKNNYVRKVYVNYSFFKQVTKDPVYQKHITINALNGAGRRIRRKQMRHKS
jgi:hypothetical protein